MAECVGTSYLSTISCTTSPARPSNLAHEAGIVVDVFERFARALGHAEEGIFCHVEGDVDFVRQTLVESAKEGTATGEIDAVLDDIGIKFGGRVAQRVEHGCFNAGNGAFQAVCDWGRVPRSRRGLRWREAQQVRCRLGF